MVKRFLVTTALEETWPESGPVLFLGEWCRLYARKDIWTGMDAEVLPYHWDDRAKLHADYEYLKEFHERLLIDLSGDLNRIHGVDHGSRYWRILIGPWLGYFVQMLFDRWCSIMQAAQLDDLSGTIVLSGFEDALIPNDMTDFSRLFIGDEWNHHLYAAILRRYTSIACVVRKQTRYQGDLAAPPVAWRQRLRTRMANGYSKAAAWLNRPRDFFFMSTYLPLRQDVELQLRFRQVPQRWPVVAPIRTASDPARRQWIASGNSRSEFEKCVRGLIPSQIPVVYLEGYQALLAQCASLAWPSRPKLIWTSNSEYSDDVFKAWAAEKVERGTPLVIGQHGGHYGMGKWSFIEDHEISICDRYLSWGWSEDSQPKIRPVGQLKAKAPLGIRHGTQPRAMLVTGVLPRYSYFMYSAAVSRQWLDYFDDQFRFVAHLPRHIRDALVVRLYPHDYGWGQAARWCDRFPALRLSDGREPMENLIRNSRLYIATYNATSYLESMAMDIPTVIFWNPAHWELRESAIPCFEELKRAGIFHETPESAARHVAAIWEDVESWWRDPSVQRAASRLTQRYGCVPEAMLDRVEEALRESSRCH